LKIVETFSSYKRLKYELMTIWWTDGWW